MRFRLSQVIAGAAILAVSLPLVGLADVTELSLDRPAIIANRQLKPGRYQLRASPNDNHVKIVKDGKIVARVPAKWINLKRKAPYSAVIISKNKIQEIEFSGKVQAVEIP